MKKLISTSDDVLRSYLRKFDKAEVLASKAGNLGEALLERVMWAMRLTGSIQRLYGHVRAAY